jgi:para-nitrobenzyl esterase
MSTDKVVVKTKYGKVRGTSQNGIYSFKGIPYGGPTGGPNRFLPPTPPEPWTGIKDATQYGPAIWQITKASTKKEFDLWGPEGFSSFSEDCLVLNVWTKGLNDNGKRPVMVWIHGGGFTRGSANDTFWYEGASLAKTQDVVLVSVNHRLGVFGYLHLAEIAGDRYASSGNAGMLDLIAALEWVRDNISKFGGDPGNVTVFGQSGGGQKICVLMAMPAAKGLFHRAIVQSGHCLKVRTPEETNKATLAFIEMLGVGPKDINILHEMPADKINAGWQAFNPSLHWTHGWKQLFPVVDGVSLLVHPFYPAAAPTASDVPLMIGTAKDDINFLLYNDPQFGKYDEATMRQFLVQVPKGLFREEIPEDRIEGLITTYRHTREGATPHDLLTGILSDVDRMDSIKIAERKIEGGKAPVYMYLFAWESPALNGSLKACHALDLPFVFNNVEPTVGVIGDHPGRFELANRMSVAWTAFARGGNPNHQGIPSWPIYSTEKRATMIFDNDCRVENDPNREERKAWHGIIQ